MGRSNIWQIRQHKMRKECQINFLFAARLCFYLILPSEKKKRGGGSFFSFKLRVIKATISCGAVYWLKPWLGNDGKLLLTSYLPFLASLLAPYPFAFNKQKYKSLLAGVLYKHGFSTFDTRSISPVVKVRNLLRLFLNRCLSFITAPKACARWGITCCCL